MPSLIYLLLSPPLWIWNGYVLMHLWRWFVVPTLGANELTLPFAVGIALVASYLTHQASITDADVDEVKRVVYSVLMATLRPLFALVVGYLVLQFV